MNEFTNIKIARFRSPDGLPTCRANAGKEEACRFLGVRNFGTISVCMLGEHRDLHWHTNGFTRPDSKCELWADEAKPAKRLQSFSQKHLLNNLLT